jgi:hypothetical protein
MLKTVARLLRGSHNPVPEFSFDAQALKTWTLLLGRDSAQLWLRALETGVQPSSSTTISYR